ncbi:MAG: AMP-binding protein [Acidimicrobiia bacterium]
MITDATNLWDLVERRAAATPNAVMLREGDRTTTFAEYRDLALTAAAGMATKHGVGEGTVVAWQLPTWTESAVLVAALSRLGAVQNPMLPLYRAKELSFMTQQLGTQLIIVPTEFRGFNHAGLAQDIAATRPGLSVLIADHEIPQGDPGALPTAPVAPEHPEDDPVRWIFYTSGTTADPKGAQHTDRGIIATSLGYSQRTHITEADVALVAFPFTHVGGIIIGVMTPLLTGSSAVLMETWTAAASTELIAKYGITLGNGAPAIHQALLEEARANPDAYATIRAFPSGGSTKPPTLHADLMAAVPSCVGITSGYGLTEMPILSQTDINAPDSSKSDGEGTAQPGVTIRIIDGEGKDVAPGTEGELIATGPMLMRGYTDPSLNEKAFTADGFFRTGDLARLDEHGAVLITGRLKDVIIRKGETISAKEVEDVLFTHPAVADVAVIGLPHPTMGEMTCAVVAPVAGETLSLEDVVAHCKAQGLMTQKFPERLELVDLLPRNASGKVLKHELRATYGN